MKNPTPATTTADTPRSFERLKHSADVGGGEMKRRGEAGEEGLSDSQNSPSQRSPQPLLQKQHLNS